MQGKVAEDTDWNLTNGHGYILNRDRGHSAAARLNLQFYLWKSALNFNIHPSIKASLPSTAAIAESPHQQWLPPNVRVRHLNILQDIPDDLIGKYDYVHTRLLVLVVESQDPRPIIRNLGKLLKPGGRLQWDELDTVNVSVQKVDPALPTPALDQLRDWTRAGGRHDWTVRLADFVTEEGFIDANMDFVGDGLELARAFNDQHMLTVEEFAEGLAKLGNAESAAKYFRLVEEAHSESMSGAALSVPRVVCTARKPL
ncbi:umta methyltransferase family protein [Colletotrichum somersetense]|nr:umta methyltransferase family protein [Colletotrichum somersetense]